MTGLTKAGRLAEFLTAENYENENRFPNGRSGDQIDQAGIAKYGEKMDDAIQNRSLAMKQFAIIFEGRMPIPGLTENQITLKI